MSMVSSDSRSWCGLHPLAMWRFTSDRWMDSRFYSSPDFQLAFPQTQPSNYRKVLREIKSKEIFNIIVDTSKEHIHLFFRTLLQLQMNNDKVIFRSEESFAF